MEKPLKIRLHIISPVNIGCDDVYEPTSFVVDEGKKKLVTFDPLDFIKSLSTQERERFVSICMQGTIGSIIDIYKFLSNRDVVGKEVDIPNDFIKHFNKVKALTTRNERMIKQELNKFSIQRTAYSVNTDLPYVPGSSLKGALRTAYLNKLALDKGIVNFKGKVKDLEFKLLGGKFDTDPFRMVKVSDFMPVGNVKTKIVYAVNKKKKPSKFPARGPFQILETIREGTIFEGFINIRQSEKGAGIRTPMVTKEFLRSVSNFFVSAINKENGIIKGINASPSVVKYINKNFEGQLGKTVFPVRVGRHSGADAVTIEGNRHIKIMQAKGSPPKFSREGATTIWLASETSKPTSNNGLTPFGWAVLELVENNFIWPAQQYKTAKRDEKVVVNKSKNVDAEDKKEEEVTKIIKDFEKFRLSPSPESFVKFLEALKETDADWLGRQDLFQIKGFNIGFADKLFASDITHLNIKKILARQFLEKIDYKKAKKRTKKKGNRTNLERYEKLKLIIES